LLKQISSFLVVDAYFSRRPFIEAMQNAGFDVVTRLHKDARLRYLYHGPKHKGRGCPKKYRWFD